MGKAMEQAVDALDYEMEDIREIRDAFEDELLKIEDTFVVTPREKRTPNTILISF
jgi:cysteine desulfurase